MNDKLLKQRYGRTTLLELIEQLKNTTNCVTQAVLKDIIIDRIKRMDLE